MKQEIINAIKEDLAQGIKDLTEGKIEEYKNDYLSPSMVLEEFKKHGFEKDDNRFDSNGWEYDNWNYVEKDDIIYMIYGCGHSGGITITKDEK